MASSAQMSVPGDMWEPFCERIYPWKSICKKCIDKNVPTLHSIFLSLVFTFFVFFFKADYCEMVSKMYQ